jgi:hypothetical protein
MTQQDISKLRLQNQHLLGEKLQTPHEIVSVLGAVQSQDYFGAKWSLAQRLQTVTDLSLDEAFNKGEILRTHVMRPTWHFVAPEDIRWMLELTSPRVKKFMASYNRKLELDDKLFAKSSAAIVKILKEKQYATRQQLKSELTNVGIKTDVQRLAHIVSWAELDAIICSGPRIGKQFTYALLEDRAPRHKTAPGFAKSKKFDRDEALATLTKRYFVSHGPAQIKDFAWWSGMTVKDAEEGLSMVKSELSEEIIDGKTYWFDRQKTVTKQKSQAFLLSIYDEYTIAYKDRSALGGQRYVEKLISMGNALTAVIIFDGKIIGTWKRVIKKSSVEINLSPFEKLNKNEHEALQVEAHKYGKFLDLPVTIKT